MNKKADKDNQGQSNKVIRDPIHGFVEINLAEQSIVDSKPFQRLRDINQLSFTYLVYPGATHKRFEHSLGVMHVAGVIFDRLFNDMEDNYLNTHFGMPLTKEYWRQVLRIAALCHDMGHLPFSHTLEGLLKEDTKTEDKKGISHEDLSKKIIEQDLKGIMDSLRINPEDVSFIATWKDKDGKDDGHSKDLPEMAWKKILSRIITNDLFGADRLDYIIRDAYHAGVPYGNIDMPQLLRAIKSIRDIIIDPDEDIKDHLSDIKEGNKAMLASFLMSRQLMYSLVYQHPVCKVYDMHLEDFVRDLNDEDDIENIKSLINKSDAFLIDILNDALGDKESKYHIHAQRILGRKHFKLVKDIDQERVKIIDQKILKPKSSGIKYTKSYDKKEGVIRFCDFINKELKQKVIGHQIKIMSKKNIAINEEQISDSYTGYNEILDVLLGGDFGFFHIYVERGWEEKVMNFIKKLEDKNL